MIIKSKQYFLPLILLLLLAVGIFLFTKQRQLVFPQALCKDCNVILITMTNLRYDHMSSNGYFRSTTPNLDKLAKESLVFSNAFAQSTWTLPEGISIYTGLYPYQHGVMNRYDGSTLSSTTPTLIDILNKNGYKTAAFTGGFDYNPGFGLTNRFLKYQECAKGQTADYPRQQGPAGVIKTSEYGEFNCTIPSALDWLKKNYNNKFFLHVQGFDAHCPFSQRGGYTYDKNYQGKIGFSDCLWTFDRSQPVIQNGKTFYPVYSNPTGTPSAVLLGEEDIFHMIALYDEAIKFADEQIGLLLNSVKEMGLSNKTIIIFTSEHGDMFGKYGRFMRGALRGTFYDDALRVPLFIKLPTVAPKKIDGLVEQIDIMPTLLGILGLKSPSDISGKSLLPLMVNGQEVNSEVFAGLEFKPLDNSILSYKKGRIEAVRTKEWKLIKEGFLEDGKNIPTVSYELFDIANDKEELHNVAGEKKDILKGLLSKLDSWSKNVRRK